MRSEFSTATAHLDQLIAHTQTHHIFPSYAARITLHHAHLYHGVLRSREALKCYRAAAWLANGGARSDAVKGWCEGRDVEGGEDDERLPRNWDTEGNGKKGQSTKEKSSGSRIGLKGEEKEYVMTEGEKFVFAAAKAGEVLLRVGIRAKARERERTRRRSGKGRSATSEFGSEFDSEPSEFGLDAGGDDMDGEGEELVEIADEVDDDTLEIMGQEAADACRGLGATLEAVGHLVEACFSERIVEAK